MLPSRSRKPRRPDPAGATGSAVVAGAGSGGVGRGAAPSGRTGWVSSWGRWSSLMGGACSRSLWRTCEPGLRRPRPATDPDRDPTGVAQELHRNRRQDAAMQLTRPDGSPVRVLVVDDEVNIAELLAMALRYEGWDLAMAHTGTDAVSTARDFRPDAVVLDIMLPDFDGLEVLRRMRADGSDVPVLFLTAKDAVEDRIAGLTAGGDDYVTKPFSLEEVVARLRG